ncbi:MAG: sigma-54-dependent Fis family transcriptional regulator, partial [Verrucomicrobia bacterium]|nr:sigma-54-dependent Fis family transcriptional regulator [Verrucomicrobiota bacterium]
ASAKKALLAHGWPGNVRELENTVQRAVVCVTSDTIQPGDLSAELAATNPVSGAGGDWWDSLKASAQEGDLLGVAEKMLLEKALQESAGNVKKAAEILGISRTALRTRILRHGLKTATE